MEYYEVINYLLDLSSSRPKLGLETTAGLLDDIGNPHEGVAYVQIAGSNGKGSTATMLERILRTAGLTVGLYTSPNLNDIRERIRINGHEVPKSHFRSMIEQIRPHIAERSADGDAPTYFEVLTVLALEYFGTRNVDVAVLEVGIGGRYDATSVVDPVASAVTNVSLEHTDILGETVEEIAQDKAHVAPTGAPLVTGASGAALTAIERETSVVTVGDEDADVHAQSIGLISDTEQQIRLDSSDWHVETRLSLLGGYQAKNAGVAALLARQVADVDEETIERGLRRTRWPGRFEIVQTDPFVVLDGAHNPDACLKLATLVEQYDYDRLHLVFGAMRDKEHSEMFRNLPSTDSITLCRPDLSRAEHLDVLSDVARRETNASIDTVTSVLEAVENAIDRSRSGDFVLVTGSLYTVAEARDRWIRPYISKQTQSEADMRELLSNSQVPPQTNDGGRH